MIFISTWQPFPRRSCFVSRSGCSHPCGALARTWRECKHLFHLFHSYAIRSGETEKLKQRVWSLDTCIKWKGEAVVAAKAPFFFFRASDFMFNFCLILAINLLFKSYDSKGINSSIRHRASQICSRFNHLTLKYTSALVQLSASQLLKTSCFNFDLLDLPQSCTHREIIRHFRWAHLQFNLQINWIRSSEKSFSSPVLPVRLLCCV